MPDDKTSVWWYSVEDLKRLVFLRIAHAEKTGEAVLLREFVKEFRNLSANASARNVCSMVPTVTHLHDFTAHESAVRTLHQAMREHGKPPSPAILGTVGREHFEACFAAQYGVKRFWYATKDLLHDGLPFIVEVAIAETVEGGGFFTGVNFSPTFDDPLAETWVHVDQVSTKGLRNFLHAAHVLPYDAQDHQLPPNRAVAVHLICPALEFLDRGKTRLAIPWWMQSPIATTLWAAGKGLYQEEEKRKKDVAQAERQTKARAQAAHDAEAREADGLPPEKDDTLADAVFAVMQDAWVHATGNGQYRMSSRGLFYAVRDRIQPLTARELTFKYFGKLVPRYQREVAPLVGLYYEQRGVLYEPHTGVVVHLGTCEVEDYVFPAWRFDKILYVEKRTLWPVLQDAGLAERYDMAIVTGEGYATEAIRVLFAQASTRHDYQLFVLHDADPSGYDIARTLREETERMPGYAVDVIDLGLFFDDAIAMGVTSEDFVRKKALPKSLPLTETERTAFEGSRVRVGGKAQWIGQRVEINALSAPQQVDYIERQLQHAQVRGKVIPPDEVLPAQTRIVYHDVCDTYAQQALNMLLPLSEIRERVVHQFEDAIPYDESRSWIEEGLREQETLSWDRALRSKVRDLLSEKREDIDDAVRLEVLTAAHAVLQDDATPGEEHF